MRNAHARRNRTRSTPGMAASREDPAILFANCVNLATASENNAVLDGELRARLRGASRAPAGGETRAQEKRFFQPRLHASIIERVLGVTKLPDFFDGA